MATLRTRASKGSELTHAELDANFKRTVSQKTTTYACLVSDNRSVIECNHASTPFTVTLGDATTMAAAETGDYEVTITNIGAAAVTVARAGSDTIDGAATSLTLAQNSSVTLQVISAGTGYKSTSRVGDVGNITAGTITSGAITSAGITASDDIDVTGDITVSGTVDGRDVAADGTALDAIGSQSEPLNTKVMDIGDWNMDSDLQAFVTHGLTYSKIRSFKALIRNDADTIRYDFPPSHTGNDLITATSTTVTLTRGISGIFDDPDFNSTSYNRGWLIIQYTD